MKSKLFIMTLFLGFKSLYASSLIDIEESKKSIKEFCEGRIEKARKRDESLNWSFLTSYFIHSSFADIRGCFFTGVDPQTQAFKKLFYTDDSDANKDVLTTKDDLFSKDVIIVDYKELKKKYFALREIPPITLKLIKNIDSTDFAIDLKYVENMFQLIGFLSAKPKLRRFSLHVKGGEKYENKIYFEQNNKEVNFDHLNINASANFKIQTIDVYSQKDKITSIVSETLPLCRRKY